MEPCGLILLAQMPVGAFDPERRGDANEDGKLMKRMMRSVMRTLMSVLVSDEKALAGVASDEAMVDSSGFTAVATGAGLGPAITLAAVGGGTGACAVAR
jgi:hypothetical protein